MEPQRKPKHGKHFRTSFEPQNQFNVTCRVIYFTVQLSKKVSKRMDPPHKSHFIDIDPTNGDVQNTSLPANPFSIEPEILTDMMRGRNLESLTCHGGVQGVAIALRTNQTHGISSHVSEMSHRKRVFGSNVYLKPPNKGLLSFAVEAARGFTIIQLLVWAVISIGLGIKQQGPSKGWYDGLNILIATTLVASISAVSNFSQSRQMEELSSKNSDVQTQVLRDGLRHTVSIFDIVVGDIVFLKKGDQIPADGLFLNGYSLEVDGSSISTDENPFLFSTNENPFLFSGAKVVNGYGRMMVTSVGMNTTWGEMMSSITQDLSNETPLQIKIKKLTTFMSKIGVAVIVVVLHVLLIRYFSGHTLTEANENTKFSNTKTGKTTKETTINETLQFFLTAVTMAAGAKFECLQPALILTLTSSMRRMIMDKCIIVRNPSAFEKLASVTIICTDKTGTLTSNEMSVAEFCVGKDMVNDMVNGPLAVNNQVQELIYQAVALSTTDSVFQVTSESSPQISGSPTEKAILDWAMHNFGMDIGAVNQNFEIMQVETHRSEKKRSGVMAREKRGKRVQVHWKGGAEIILAMCSNYYDRNGMLLYMENEDNLKFNEIIKNMASKSLRCIAFAHKQTDGKNLMQFNESELTLLAIVGLKNPCRLDVQEAVKTCRNAKVAVKMITGDNLFTAKAIGLECGIIKPEEQLYDEAVIQGAEFRNWSLEERMQKLDQILVMARSLPSDKLLMVQCLKLKGHVVAITGKRASDAAALKEAHVGLSMGVQGTQVAKESSGLIILDDNFASIVTALKWSRCAYTNILKTIQFQVTTSIVGHIVNVVILFFSGSAPLLRPDNLIVDILSSLVLVNEPLNDDIMTRPPVTGYENLLTKIMWKNLFIQILGLVAILLALQFKGKSMFGVSDELRDTIVFNCFVLCQVFHQFNVRSPEKENIFKGIHRNKGFLGYVGTAIVLQVLQIMFLTSFADTEQLTWKQWGACVAIAAITWLFNWLLKCVQGLINI